MMVSAKLYLLVLAVKGIKTERRMSQDRNDADSTQYTEQQTIITMRYFCFLNLVLFSIKNHNQLG